MTLIVATCLLDNPTTLPSIEQATVQQVDLLLRTHAFEAVRQSVLLPCLQSHLGVLRRLHE